MALRFLENMCTIDDDDDDDDDNNNNKNLSYILEGYNPCAQALSYCVSAMIVLVFLLI